MPERKEDRGLEGGSRGEAREEEASSSDGDLACQGHGRGHKAPHLKVLRTPGRYRLASVDTYQVEMQ